ncbi:hypothetical protein Tco_1393527 [Tanacetum coccineum]
MHDPLVWRLYDTCGVHQVSSVRGHDIFMLVEKEYPLTRGTLGLMMVARQWVEVDSEMSRELLRKVFYQANRPRFTELEQVVKELKQADHFTAILVSIRYQVPSVVEDYLGSSLPDALKKNFLPKFLPKAVKDALEKTALPFAQSSSPDQSAITAAESLSEYELKKILYAKMHKSQSHLTHDTHQELYDALTWSMLLDEANTKEDDNPDKVLKKRDRRDDQDEDPFVGPNQGMKKRRTGKDAEPLKKSSKTKESAKG